MNIAQRRILFPAAALLALAATPAHAQRPPSPEQRILLLEQQLAASQAAAIRLEQRLGAIERQLQQLINQGEVGGHRVAVLESELAKLRADIDRRLTELERRPAVVRSSDAAPDDVAPVQPNPRQTATATVPRVAESADPVASDPGEDAYSLGFRLWRDGKYDEAITALRAFTAGFPDHRRVSFANNLIGRAMLDDGKPRPAAEAFLANYRADPKGERAPDSLYYLGQSLMRISQPTQACKAYSELESVYGPSIRADLMSLVAEAKAEANCS
ncbi:MAG: tetratricopeptide repeat protein [Sphingomicrobium sp.]